MLPEALAAVVVGIALLWLVLQPVLLPGESAPVVDDIPEVEETPRGRALLALKEIEFDRATGKLSDEDYAALRDKYSALAVQALEAAPAATRGDAIEAMIAARAATLPDDGARFCTGCGTPIPAGGRFCIACGTAVAAERVA